MTGGRRHRVGELLCARHRVACAEYWPVLATAIEFVRSCPDCMLVAHAVTKDEDFQMRVPDWGGTEFGREHDAFHEAGHTVAAVMAGIPILRVRLGSSVVASELTGTGEVDAEGAVEIGHGSFDTVGFAAFVWAGMRATRKWLIDNDSGDQLNLIDSMSKGGHDVAALRHNLGPHALPIHTGRARADEIITRHWPAVQAVADLLLRERTLSGRAVADLLAPLLPVPVLVADPDTTDDSDKEAVQ
ncbi:hypothetical protein [Nocardia yamanashiensis]|uniref:hypothetical protein n=1 Tax=Nocardia yamanashiensis TaxID=209247 RepID=UPI0012FE0DF9|nr:hypothetical protein [Nocardia yamanashiensis]